MNLELAVGALLLSITHIGFLFLGFILIVVSKRKRMHLLGWILFAFGSVGIFASIYMGLFYQAGLDHQ